MLPTVRRTWVEPFAMLREMDRAFNRYLNDEDGTPVGASRFAVDVREADDRLVVEAELPGFAKDQIAVSVEQGVLTIEARRGEQPSAGTSHLRERSVHAVRRFTLPSVYDASRVDAKLEHGVLTLSLPKRDEVKPRFIEVK